MEFDFQQYIQERTRAGASPAADAAGVPYAFGRDAKVMRSLERAKPVKMALEVSHRIERARLDEILGEAEAASETRDAKLFALVGASAKALGISPPALMITQRPGALEIQALLVDGEPVVLLDRDMVDRFDETALGFFIGQQLGHIQNQHLVFLTTAFALRHLEEAFLGWVVRPANFAIDRWLKLGQLTADRAGLLACGDLHAAVEALLKRHAPEAIESPLNIDVILEEAQENPKGSLMTGVAQVNKRLPGRLASLKAFSDSELFRRSKGRDGGQSMTSVDRRVESIIKLW